MKQVLLQGFNFFICAPTWKIKEPQCSCLEDFFCCCCNQYWKKRKVLHVPQKMHMPPDWLWLLCRQGGAGGRFGNGCWGVSWNRETFLSHCCCLAQPVERAEHRDPGKPARGNKLLWLWNEKVQIFTRMHFCLERAGKKRRWTLKAFKKYHVSHFHSKGKRFRQINTVLQFVPAVLGRSYLQLNS